jgi:hypothetical protein
MSHWAELNDNNEVLRVLVGDNNDPNGDEGYQWLLDNLGGRWVKTSYNATIRKNYAGPGFIYDETFDAFIPPKPYPSWILDEETYQWKAPKEQPTGEKAGDIYEWYEEDLEWKLP